MTPVTPPPVPALYRCVLTHERHEGVQHKFGYVIRLWLIDLDAPPRPHWALRPLLAFRSADHLGDPRSSIRANVDHYLRLNGIDLCGGRVLMLAQARALGHVFDPVSIFWCLDHTGRLACVIAEVRNTFGERHCYLFHPDERGGARLNKEFYVSPLFTVDGHYLVRISLTGNRLSVTFVLRRPVPGGNGERTALVARLNGELLHRGRLWAVLSHPFATYRITALIYYQSRRLRRKGLPMRRRRYHAPQPGVTRPAIGEEHAHGIRPRNRRIKRRVRR